MISLFMNLQSIQVYEEDCIPVLEKKQLKINKDFFAGYSPERINPGDKDHTVTKILSHIRLK